MSEQEIDTETALNQQTGQLPWGELVKHFARGVLVKVSSDLDLIEVAETMVKDDTKMIEQWLACEQVMRASDDDARDWTAREPLFWSVVVAPWVLVQECKQDVTLH